MKQFATINTITVSADSLTVLAHNVESLSKHVDDTVSDDRTIKNDIIGLAETNINSSDLTCKIIGKFIFFNISLHNNKNYDLSNYDISVFQK